MNEIISLTKRFLQEEYPLDEWIWTDKTTYDFFKGLSTPPLLPQKTHSSKPVTTPTKSKPKPSLIKRQTTPTISIEKPEPIKTTPKRTSYKPESFKRDYSEIKKLLAEVAPKLKIIDSVPPDDEAKLIANAWNNSIPEVAIIVIEPSKEQLLLLERMAKAIEGLGRTSKVLIGEQQWEKLFKTKHLKLILVPQETLDAHPDFAEITTIKICPMAPIQTYLEQPQEKTKLWKNIQALLM